MRKKIIALILLVFAAVFAESDTVEKERKTVSMQEKYRLIKAQAYTHRRLITEVTAVTLFTASLCFRIHTYLKG